MTHYLSLDVRQLPRPLELFLLGAYVANVVCGYKWGASNTVFGHQPTRRHREGSYLLRRCQRSGLHPLSIKIVKMGSEVLDVDFASCSSTVVNEDAIGLSEGVISLLL